MDVDEGRQGVEWRAWLAGGMFVALLAAALWLNGRGARPEGQPAQAPFAKPRLVGNPLPQPDPPLDRAGLIEAAASAASAFAAGRDASADEQALVGRRFELRLPFGCQGPAPAGTSPSMGWTYDAKEESLRVFAKAQNWKGADWLSLATGGADVGAAEGFWIERPWLRSGDCPAARAAIGSSMDVATEVAAPEGIRGTQQQLGIVHLLPVDAPRSAARGGRAYTAVVKRPPERVGDTSSFALVVSGRVATFPGKGPIACRGDPVVEAPKCLIATQIEQVAIVDRNGERVAAWPE